MTVKWEQFAKRRGLNLRMFINTDYAEYKSWCIMRKVEPVSQAAFEAMKPPTPEQPQQMEPDVVKHEIFSLDIPKIKKMRKNQLIKFCKDKDIHIDETQSKREIINQLISLNNT